jgi:hypothetical protein
MLFSTQNYKETFSPALPLIFSGYNNGWRYLVSVMLSVKSQVFLPSIPQTFLNILLQILVAPHWHPLSFSRISHHRSL